MNAAVKAAAKILRTSSTTVKNAVLISLAEKLKSEESKILAANAKDLAALSPDVTAAFIDRLTLSPARLAGMRESLKQVAALPDPVNEVVEKNTLANGISVTRVRAPLGIIFMIFESRPNVAIEAFSLAFKAGNAVILRSGKESKNTVEVFYTLMQAALRENQLPVEIASGITDPDRALVLKLLQLKNFIDVVVPRGGDALIEFVVENSKIPIIKNDRGLCHIYVHEDAELKSTVAMIENAKKQRPGVCNSVETILIHEKIAAQFIPAIHAQLAHAPHPVEWFACGETLKILAGRPFVQAATPKSFDTEYLDYQLNCRVVKNADEAIAHIETHGSKHSEAIFTQTESLARKFQNEIDAAAVYWNASTRFTDGFELGLGGELGISTQKLHVRGPVGLRELTSTRWLLDGNGQIRK
jgi:glutamate-5-semialdehyde dehydrogenase